MNFIPGWHGMALHMRQFASPPPVKTAIGTQATNESVSGTLSPGLPAGATVGDLLLLLIMGTQLSSVPTVSGYTLLGSTAVGAQNARFAVFYRIATGSDACSFTNTNGGFVMARIIGYRGVKATGSFDNTQSAVDVVADGATPAYALFSTSGPNRLMLQCFGTRDATVTAATPGSGWTEDLDTTAVDSSSISYSMQIDSRVFASAGSPPAGVHTYNGTPAQSIRAATALVPA